MQKDVLIALKQMNDTINDLIRRVDNMAQSHYEENSEKIVTLNDKEGEQDIRMDCLQEGHDENVSDIIDLEEMVVDILYDDTLSDLGLDDLEGLDDLGF